MVWERAACKMHMDFSQSYRKIDGYEKIIFVYGGEYYKRTFWGLKKIKGEIPDIDETELSETSEEYKKAISILGDDEYIRKSALSPDGNKVIVVEVHPWGYGMTDAEDDYFKVVDLTDGSVVTVFKGSMQFFNACWRR